MTKRQPQSFSYLLRIQADAGQESRDRRASLQDLSTGKRVVFPDLESLFAFIENACAVSTAPQQKEATDRTEAN